ncbi:MULTISPECIES: GNAT family N-acetyltransferase [Yersiniaceae]|uniref:GNAT family N-acetyltransferase n=2 Tax=Yersiniaceae TaxID=1903411 RepID=A0A2N5EKJ3_9GAMM|nr:MULTISPECIES: GNAT family N-acetyltransferase [Yersiniaceae]MBS0968489.1 GNAT family N-acetyltransferase [Nissabacter archeti]PLR47043.1 GNAT family N-acetyltransferase [Chimaeribacter arupi]
MDALVPVITTDRLVLRAHTLADAAEQAELWANENVTRYIGGNPSTTEESWSRLLRYAGHWHMLGFGYWAVEERSSGRYIGCTGFADYQRALTRDVSGKAEMGWTFLPAFHGKGYATEAVQAAQAWAAGNLKKPIFCMINPDNQPSIRLALKAGFLPDGEDQYHGRPVNLYAYRAAGV